MQNQVRGSLVGRAARAAAEFFLKFFIFQKSIPYPFISMVRNFIQVSLCEGHPWIIDIELIILFIRHSQWFDS